MKLSDDSNHYGLVSRINHWIGALVVLILLGIGLYFHEMPKGDERFYWLHWHVAFGALTFLFLVFRIIWRLTVQSPQPIAQHPLQQTLIRVIHGLLLLAITLLLVTGPFIVWSVDRPIEVFGWFSWPSPIGEMQALHEFLEDVHKVVSRVLLLLIIVHVLATLKHVLINRDQTLMRMLWNSR